MSEQEKQPHDDEPDRPASGQHSGGEEGGEEAGEQVYHPPNSGATEHDEPPGPSGYEGRDPKSDMPRLSSAPETQEE